jgi:ABC-type multidrug transport system permease subunit
MTDPNLTDAQIADVWAYAESNNLVDGDDFNLDGINYLCFNNAENRVVYVNIVWVYTV